MIRGRGDNSNGWSYEKRTEQEDGQYMEQDKEQQGELDGRRTLTEGVKGSFLWNLTRRRSCGDYIYTPVGGRLPNLVCFGGKLTGILDVFYHQVGADVRVKVVEEETLEHKALGLVDPMFQRKQTTHLACHGGWFLVRHQNEGHPNLVPLEGIQGVEFCEWFLEGFVRILVRGKLDEINYIGHIIWVEGSHTVVELGEA